MDSNFLLIGVIHGIFNLNESKLTELGFQLKTSSFDNMLHHHLFAKFKLIKICKLNHLINILTKQPSNRREKLTININ
jgi:hypothetical protein